MLCLSFPTGIPLSSSVCLSEGTCSFWQKIDTNESSRQKEHGPFRRAMQPAKTGLILSVRVAACSVIILAAAIRLHCIVIKNPSRRRRHCLFFCQYPCKGSPSPLHFSRKGGKINRTHPRIHGDTKFSLQLQKTTPNSHTKEHPKNVLRKRVFRSASTTITIH